MSNREEKCQPCPYKEMVDQSWNAIFLNGNAKGSIMVRINTLEGKVEVVDEKFDQLQRSIDNLPKKLLTWLLIFGALIAILQFIGPSVRKTMGLASAHMITLAADKQQSAEIPALGGSK